MSYNYSSKNQINAPGAWDGFLKGQSDQFDEKVTKLNEELATALTNLQQDPSNPAYLSAYQALVSEYQLYRSAQSNITKTYKDISSGIISNFR